MIGPDTCEVTRNHRSLALLKAFFTGILLPLILTAQVAQASSQPIEVEISLPDNSTEDLVWVSESGWPLTVQMRIDQKHLKRVEATPDNGFMLTLRGRRASRNGPIHVYPDIDTPGVPDTTGQTDLQALLVDSAGSLSPQITTEFDNVVFGPLTGNETLDGYGFGTNDDLPGLFVFSEVGVGLVWDTPNWQLKPGADGLSTFGVRNLAGLMNQVSFEQAAHRARHKGKSDKSKKSGSKKSGKDRRKPSLSQVYVSASAAMPLGLIKNMLNLDVGNQKLSIDGQPAIDLTSSYSNKVKAARTQMNRSLVIDEAFQIQAFMVSGLAPDELYDLNGNGHIDQQDAKLAGYTVLSNTARVKVGVLPIRYPGTCGETRDLNAIYGRLVPCPPGSPCPPEVEPGCEFPGGVNGTVRPPR